MILLRPQKLRQLWLEGGVTETLSMKYLLVSSLAITLGYYLPREMSSFVWVNRLEILVMFVVSIAGIYWAFLKNGAGSGQEFIQRFITFSVPVGIQLLLASAIISLIYQQFSGYIMMIKGQSDATVFGLDLGYLVLTVIIELIYFWMIGNNLSQLRSEK